MKGKPPADLSVTWVKYDTTSVFDANAVVDWKSVPNAESYQIQVLNKEGVPLRKQPDPDTFDKSPGRFDVKILKQIEDFWPGTECQIRVRALGKDFVSAWASMNWKTKKEWIDGSSVDDFHVKLQAGKFTITWERMTVGLAISGFQVQLLDVSDKPLWNKPRHIAYHPRDTPKLVLKAARLPSEAWRLQVRETAPGHLGPPNVPGGVNRATGGQLFRPTRPMPAKRAVGDPLVMTWQQWGPDMTSQAQLMLLGKRVPGHLGKLGKSVSAGVATWKTTIDPGGDLEGGKTYELWVRAVRDRNVTDWSASNGNLYKIARPAISLNPNGVDCTVEVSWKSVDPRRSNYVATYVDHYEVQIFHDGERLPKVRVPASDTKYRWSTKEGGRFGAQVRAVAAVNWLNAITSQWSEKKSLTFPRCRTDQ